MPLNTLTLQQRCIPSAAASISLTAPGTAWANSAYSELVASVSSASVLAGFFVRVTVDGGTVDVEVDIATGAAASEVVISSFRFGHQGDGMCNYVFRLPIGIDNIANGARLAARIRVSTTTAVVCPVAILLYDKPVTATYLTTAQPVVALPPAADSLLLTANATAWLNGSYVQLRSASGAALILMAVINYYAPTGSHNCEIDVATGGAGSETVVTTVAVRSDAGTGNQPGWANLSCPLDNIAASTRVAMRMRSSAAGGQTMRVSAMAIEKPL